MNITGTIGVVEFLWMLLVVPAALFKTWIALELWKDREVLKATGQNGLKEIIVSTGLRAEVSRALAQWIFVGIGISAMTQAPPHHAPSYHEIGVTVAFLLVALLLLRNSIAEYIKRRRIRKEFMAKW